VVSSEIDLDVDEGSVVVGATSKVCSGVDAGV